MNRMITLLCLTLIVPACGDAGQGTGAGGSGGTDGGMDGGMDGGGNTKIQPAACRNSFNNAVSDFAIEVTVDSDGPVQAGQSFTVDITPRLSLSQTFLQGAADALGGFGAALETVTLDTTQVEIGVVGTTTGDSVLSVLSPVPQTVPIPHEAPDGQVPTVITGPVAVDLPTVTGDFTAGAAGETAYFCVQGDVPDIVMANDPASQTYVEATVAGALRVDFACELGTPDAQDPEIDEDDTVVPGDPETDCNAITIEP